MSDTYQTFIDGKTVVDPPTGLTSDPEMAPHLYPFQSDIVRWALRRGRAAIFADCGMGKTPMQLEWARQVHLATGRNILVLAPLAVAHQTIAEGSKFGVGVHYAENQASAVDGITITNYERFDGFDPSRFGGVVLDESSILKSFTGATSQAIISRCHDVPFRLACTATPAPNDYMELGTHAEFVGAMSRPEMLAMFFVHDGGETQKWRIRGHGQGDFWRWLGSWAVMIRRPSDLGYSDDGFTLPPMEVTHHVVASPASDGELFAVQAQTLAERLAARRGSIDARAAECASLVNQTDGPWIVWCHLNKEADAICRLVPDAVEVRGSDDHDIKVARLRAFSDGTTRVLVTKPSIAGFGMNWQHCHQMAFVGLSDSWEQYYQATRRCWRFGQLHPVQVHIVTSETEGAVVANIKRKDADAAIMATEMAQHVTETNVDTVRGGSARSVSDEARRSLSTDKWTLYQGDCVEELRSIKSESVGFSVFSPPFASLYTYSNSPRDMGNCRDHDTFYRHFGFAVAEIYRVLMTGRLVSFHCMNLPTSKARDGIIGLKDFRGELIRLFESHGFVYHSEVCIWKDPVTAMQRTKALGLLHKTIRNDSSMARQGIADYIVTMRKPGHNPEPISHTSSEFPVALWQQYASPVWMDIDPQDTMEYRSARQDDDERHIAPLQLQVIRRAIRLWSNPGDVVLSPFAGIGSEGVVAIEEDRRFVGIELKPSYFDRAVKHLMESASLATSDLFTAASAGVLAAMFPGSGKGAA